MSICLTLRRTEGVMNGPLKFLTARKILPVLDLLAKFKRVLACSCSPSLYVARKLAKQIFYSCSCSQKNRSARLHRRKMTDWSSRDHVTLPHSKWRQYLHTLFQWKEGQLRLNMRCKFTSDIFRIA